ncbi:MAG: neutral/alkaline non-lysosomal ceramidase N-terminal domain-containing protein [Armatimonadetes bacterium]|nr:neutral/alkaline non-lysosomal ceramidase N-terminal domain-containing protein [Armatimonadota bacterium]
MKPGIITCAAPGLLGVQDASRLLLTAGLAKQTLWNTPSPQAAAAGAPGWVVGAAKVDVTPDYPVRLNGYGGRRTEHEGVAQRIFAKAIAIGGDADGPAVLLTVDNLGVRAAMRDEIVGRLEAKTGIANSRLAICASHTHRAPMLAGVAPNLFSMDIPPDHRERIQRYTGEFTDKLEQVALAALADRQPAHLAWGYGHVSFAHNRRNMVFRPEDHSLPVLQVTDVDGKVRAFFTSYACHCTTTAFNTVHGDWAGCAQEQIEKDFPGAVALTALGCGADQNPNPRSTVELVEQYGRDVAAEVKRVVEGKLTPLTGGLECRAKTIALPFAKLPTRAEWEEKAKGPAEAIAYHAQKNLARLDRGESIPTELSYLVQAWSFGDGLAMVFLPGEITVDYSLRLKLELDSQRLWVNGYANDVSCYIPSERVLAEGGYEGGGAMVYYDRPERFAPGIEERILGAVRELVPETFQRPR